MQTNYKDLYELAAAKNNVSEQIYKDIGTFVFSELHRNLRRPESLIIKLKGVGSWYLRKKRIEEALKWFPEEYNKTLEDFSAEREFFRYENKKEVYNIFKARLEDYEKYILIRNETRDIRYKSQVLLEPDPRKD